MDFKVEAEALFFEEYVRLVLTPTFKKKARNSHFFDFLGWKLASLSETKLVLNLKASFASFKGIVFFFEEELESEQGVKMSEMISIFMIYHEGIPIRT